MGKAKASTKAGMQCFFNTGADEAASGTSRTRESSPSVRSKKTASNLVLSAAAKGIIRDFSYRLEVPAPQLEMAVAATRLGSESLNLFEFFIELSRQECNEDMVERAAKSFSDVLHRLVSTDEDPLAEVDKASEEEVLRGQIESEIESAMRREKLLAGCVSVEEAVRLAKRTRQRLEELHREGRLIAIRVKNRWMYPRWQFDPDFAGGVVPGIGEVLRHLQLSPAGSAAWLTTPSGAIGNQRPIDLLKAGKQERVVQLAEEQGYMP